MSDLIASIDTVLKTCAVFKIDLKGRFVYIDEETEDLLGLTREELFGKSIHEFVSPETHRLFERIFSNKKKYESFYRSLPVEIRTDNNDYTTFNAVITLNFITGNPVNYQIIIIPEDTETTLSNTNYDGRFLGIIQKEIAELDMNGVAQFFGEIGGYREAYCYLPGKKNILETVGIYPGGNPARPPAAYLEKFCNDPQNRYSSVSSHKSQHDGFGTGKSEAVLFLNHHGDRNLIVHLYGPANYELPKPRRKDLNRYTRVWNRTFDPSRGEASLSKKLDAVGNVLDSMDIAISIVDKEFEIIYCNRSFVNNVIGEQNFVNDCKFSDLMGRFEIPGQKDSEAAFEVSPFFAAVTDNKLTTGPIKPKKLNYPLLLVAGPLGIKDVELYAYCFISCPITSGKTGIIHPAGRALIASLAHDLRAPLVTIDSFTQKMQRSQAEAMDDDGRFAVNCISENVKTLNNMIEALGAMASNWVQKEEPEPVRVRELIDSILPLLKAAYPDTEFSVQLPDNLPQLTIQKRRLNQVFKNILDNAFKYTALNKNPLIKITYNNHNNVHNFSISDNGPGIGKEYVNKIFNPFFRTPEALTIPGTGMGLAIVHDIVSSWGGGISAERADTGGLIVSFSLPDKISE